MRFSVSSRLEYEVRTPAVFILNVEAAALRNQRILAESLQLNPAVALDRHEVPALLLLPGAPSFLFFFFFFSCPLNRKKKKKKKKKKSGSFSFAPEAASGISGKVKGKNGSAQVKKLVDDY